MQANRKRISPFEDQSRSASIPFVQYARSLRLCPLFVISNDGLEEIAKAFISARLVLAGHLQQQAFDLVEAAQLRCAIV